MECAREFVPRVGGGDNSADAGFAFGDSGKPDALAARCPPHDNSADLIRSTQQLSRFGDSTGELDLNNATVPAATDAAKG